MLFKNKLYLFTLFIVLLLMFVPNISARSYSIDSFDINYTLNPNGIINVSEKLMYSLSGCYTELFIQKPNDLVIENPSGYCTGSTCDFIYKSTKTISGEKELILKGSYCDTSVTTYFSYDINNQIRVLVDGAQFYYQLYGGRTEVSTFASINIFLPGDVNQTTQLIHSQGYMTIIPISMNTSNLINISKPVSSNEIIEINLLMPKTWFDINSPNFYRYQDNNYTIEQVKEIDSNWQEGYDAYNSSFTKKQEPKINPFFSGLIFILIIFSFIFLVWLIFGKEYSRSQVGYFGVFERDLPEDEDPVKANYFIKGDFPKDWFSSAILYLVWKKHFELLKNSNGDFILIKTKKEVDVNVLPDYVVGVYKYLIKHYPSQEINLEDLKSRLSGKGVKLFSKGFISKLVANAGMQEEFKKLYISTKKKYDSWFEKSKLFKGTGYGVFTVFLVLLFPISFISSGILFNGSYMFIVFLFVFIFSFTSRFFFYKVIFGRFTREGRLKNLKWEAFKRYITTFSLMKQHPPQSVIIWEEYMVYATAMGVAKKTAKALETVLPEEFNHNDRFVAYSGFGAFASSFSTATGGSSGSHGGGSGGFGGGGGGGGGGAR